MSEALARLLLGNARPAGRALGTFLGGTCTAWDPATYANAVRANSTDYVNLPVLDPAGMSTGRVFLAMSPAGPIILGRLHQYQAPPPPP